MIHAHKPNSDLAQLAEHETDDLEVVSSTPCTGGQFLTKFILFCVTLDLSDNLTEMRVVKNSNVAACTTMPLSDGLVECIP